MVDTLTNIFTAAREGRNPQPEMIGEELAQVRAELRDLYARWADEMAATGQTTVAPPSGPAYEWLALRVVGALPGLLATIAMQNEALARIAQGHLSTDTEGAKVGGWEIDHPRAIAHFARLLAGTEED